VRKLTDILRVAGSLSTGAVPHSPRVGFIVTNMSRPPENVVAIYNKRGTCEQWIKEGKGAIRWTRHSCRSFAANAVRLQLHALAYNLGNFLRTLATPEPIKDWSLARAGKSLWIVRDLTDAALGRSTTGLTDYATQWDGTGNLYKHAFKPGGPQAYDHFDGTDLVVDWIGRTLGAATWTSAQVTGRPRLVFPGDSPSRVWPRVA
jgi:hypothetical protein